MVTRTRCCNPLPARRDRRSVFDSATLKKIHNTGSDCFEARKAEEAIAAADTLARLMVRFHENNGYTEGVDQCVEARPQKIPPALLGRPACLGADYAGAFRAARALARF